MKLFSAAETDHNRTDYWKFFAHHTPIAGQSFLEGNFISVFLKAWSLFQIGKGDVTLSLFADVMILDI